MRDSGVPVTRHLRHLYQLLSSPPFPNLIGEARVDGNRHAVMHSLGGQKCRLIEPRQPWFSSTRKSMY
jgi:hypothetical protein